MFDSAVLDVVVGLVFLLATFSVIVSVLTEGVSRFLGWRGTHLLRGIRALVDGDWKKGTTSLSTYKLLQSPFAHSIGQKHRGIKPLEAPPPESPTATGAAIERVSDGSDALVNPDAAEYVIESPEDLIEVLDGQRPSLWKQRRKLPSYISSRQFASAVLGEILPDRDDDGTARSFGETRDRIDRTFGTSTLGKALVGIVNEVGDDVDQIRVRIERTFDDHMDRVSGWYKRKTFWAQLVFALVVVLLFNINLLRVAGHLHDSDTSRAAVVSIAEKAECGGEPGSAENIDCTREILEKLSETNLPIMWQDSFACPEDSTDECGFWERKRIWDPDAGRWTNGVVIAAGYAIAWLGLVPGSRFWFDALSKLNTLRSGGRPPAKADENDG